MRQYILREKTNFPLSIISPQSLTAFLPKKLTCSYSLIRILFSDCMELHLILCCVWWMYKVLVRQYNLFSQFKFWNRELRSKNSPSRLRQAIHDTIYSFRLISEYHIKHRLCFRVTISSFHSWYVQEQIDLYTHTVHHVPSVLFGCL